MTVRRIKDVLFVLSLMGLVAVILRLTTGLGATTALSDELPWGVWKILNMVAGVAVATGGFTLACAVHVFGIKSLRPVLRPALLVAFLGYGSSCFALLLDIGLPHRIWHPIVHWNEHSFLFEVAWCVMLYFTVTVLEVTPIALEGSRFHKPYRVLKAIAMPVVIIGITLSTLHHTSLGSLFLVSPTRLHPLWYTSLLPVHFILSAVGAGMMFVVLVTLTVARIYRRQAPTAVLSKVAGAAAVVLAVYLATKVADLAARGVVVQLLSGEWEARLFIAEIALGAALPVALVAVPAIRRSNAGLAAASLLAVCGMLLNRLDVGIFAYFRSAGATYFPSLTELAITIGIPAAAGLFFLLFVERFQVFELGEAIVAEEPTPACTAFDKPTGVWSGVFIDNMERLTLMAVIVIPLAVGIHTLSADADQPASTPVAPPLGADAARSELKIDGNRDGRSVRFPHEDHKSRLGGEESCGRCHHLDLPGDKWTSCHQCHSDMTLARSIFDHDHHVARVAERLGFTGTLAGNHACAECHDPAVPESRAGTKACHECHAEDMRMSPGAKRQDRALAYKDALHLSCVGCHEESSEEAERPHLGECGTCHRSM